MEEMVIKTCRVANYIAIKKLKHHPQNEELRSISDERMQALKDSIIKKGFYEPILVWKKGGFVLAGNQRLRAVRELIEDGYEIQTPDGNKNELPVVIEDVDEKMALQILHQANNHHGDWVQDKLIEAIKEAEDMGITLADLGYTDDYYKKMVDEAMASINTEEDPKESLTDDDAVPVVTESIVKKGDVWLLGEHRMMCGDSTRVEHLTKLMNGQKADLVFTDPPYNQETEGGFSGLVGKALEKQSSEIEHLCNFEPKEFLNVLPTLFPKNKMNAIVFCNKDLVVDYLKWARDNGYAYNILFWKKPSAIPIGGSYRPDVEYIIVFRKNGIFNGGLDANYSKCLEHGREKDKVHPTMKPVEMIANQLTICSSTKGIVVDTFLGSGSTIIACEKTNRTCYGMELDEKYCDIIINRWQNYTGKKAVKVKK